MSSSCEWSQPRAARAPLRDLQNDPHLTIKHASVHDKVPEVKHEGVSVETSSNLMKCDVQTIISTSEACSDEATDGHEDITLKSFVCLEGEVVVEDGPVKSDESVVIWRLAVENNHPPEFGLNETNELEARTDNQTNEEHVDHPYSHAGAFAGSDSSSVLDAREEVSTCELGSVMCFGGKVEISDSSVIPDESTLTRDLASGNNLKCLETNAHISTMYPEALSVNSQPTGRSYCNLKAHVSSSEDSSQCAGDVIVHTSQSADEQIASSNRETQNTAKLKNHGPGDPSEGCQDFSSREGEITFKSLCCSGVELEIADLSKVSEMSLYVENPAEDQSQPCLTDISEHCAHSVSVLSPGSKHVDHVYCHINESVDVSREETQITESVPKKMETSPMCHEMEMETSKSVSSQHLSALNHGENKMENSHTVQSNIEQSLSDDTHKVPSDDGLVMAQKVAEKDPNCHLKAFSGTETNPVLSCSQSAFSENVDPETSSITDVALDLKDKAVVSGIEVMRLCDQTGESISVPHDLTSAFALTAPCTPKMSAVSRSVLCEHTLSHLWPELPESPMAAPQFNSTALANAFSYTPVPAEAPQAKDPEAEAASGHSQKMLNDPPVVSNGPLQEQLRHVAELLMLASGKVKVPAPVNQRSALVGTSPVEKRSVSVCRTPIHWVEKSINTSAVEIVKEVDVSDASTLTDSLLWNLTSGNLEHLSRSDLEQRLTSTLIMVEVLSQQLTAARGYNPSRETSPSDLREKLIQTDHTELRQNGTYKDLYVVAQERIQSLEQDQEILQSLYKGIQGIRVGMSSVKSSTEEAICTMKQIGDIVHVDQEALYRQVSQMKCLYGRYRETLQLMEQKMKDARQNMDRAVQEKEAAFSVTQQLREYYTAQVAGLEHSVGCHQELMSSLTLARPSLVELCESLTESFSDVSVCLKRKQEDHTSLSEELRKAQKLIERTKPVLQQLYQRASVAVEQSKEHLTLRERAVQERQLMEDELEQVKLSFQDASEQISDLKMQNIILTSEMSVLREQLNHMEEERSQLQRTNTELSATVTSTLASYAFLEQSLAAETSKLQQEMHDSHQATERVKCLEAELESCRKQMKDYEAVLSQRESLIQELHTEAELHHHQLRQLAQLRTELCSAREMVEFLQAENELAREQMEESERFLRCHLQSLRDRNVECEDLKLSLEQLRLEKVSLQEELDSTKEKARQMLLEQGEKMLQASNDVILLNHRVSCLTDVLKESLINKESEGSDKVPQSHRDASGSFLDSVMVAMMKPQEPQTDSLLTSEERESQHDGIGSECSAFTRIPPTAHTQVKEERRNGVLELLSDLGENISDLQATIDQLRVKKETEQQSLQTTVCGLQEAVEAASLRHMQEESELRQAVDRLQARVERDAAALQQKSQDERSLRKLCSELQENVEAAHKHRAENSELRREVADLRRLEQQAQVEAQVLREELKRTGVQSAASTAGLDERIKLLREVEKLKANLMETEENRAKVLERAKRHQRVHAVNQSKLERELHLLDDMIETVRRTLSSIPDLVKNCPELQKLVEYIG